MAPHPKRPTSLPLLALCLGFLVACSGQGTGCGAMTAIPGGRYEGPKTDNAVNLRLSPGGINYLNSNWRTLIDAFAPGQVLNVPLGCSVVDTGVVGVNQMVIADQGSAGCGAESCGQMDGACNASDRAMNIPVTITGFSLVPKSPDTLEVRVSLRIDTGNVYVSTVSRNAGICLGLSPVKGSVRFNNSPDSNALDASVKFEIDTRWDKALSFEVTTINGTQVCGSGGAPAFPRCLNPDDVAFSGENNCANVYFGIANVGLVKGFLLRALSPMLQDRVKDAVAGQSCRTCSTSSQCPDLPGGATSSCVQGQCIDDSTKACVPRFIGIEGRVSPAAFLDDFGVSTEAKLDLSVMAGSTVKVDQGLSVGTRGGVVAVTTAACVPKLAAPSLESPAPPNLDASAPAGTPYHMGITVSRPFLDLTLYQAHQAGTLCMSLSSENVGVLNTGLFKTFLPSLGKLATRDGKDAPMMVVLRPQGAPRVDVGEGTYDPVTQRPIKPLLTLSLPDFTVDFYAMIDDRQVRLFSLTADIKLPLSLIFEGCSSITPALGDLKELVTNIRTADSEILAEDPKVLADLIPAIIGLAEPAIAGALKPFDLPDLGQFKLRVRQAKGVGPITGSDFFHHLALYAELLPQAAACAVPGPSLQARLEGAELPTPEQMRLTGNGLLWPVARVRVDTDAAASDAEFSWRVGQGMWTEFVPADAGLLRVSHPSFVFQGSHRIQVRVRSAAEPAAVSVPAAVAFDVDYEAPSVSLVADREQNRLKVEAWDAVTPREGLRFAYRVGPADRSFTAFGPAREIDLSAIEAAGGFAVKVQDAAGHEAVALHRMAQVDYREEASVGAGSGPGSSSGAGAEGGGCTAAGGGLGLSALGALLGLVARRRARSGR